MCIIAYYIYYIRICESPLYSPSMMLTFIVKHSDDGGDAGGNDSSGSRVGGGVVVVVMAVYRRLCINPIHSRISLRDR